MAKGIGLIGNFRGKVGNMVGYNLKDSNNKQTQGVRVYQPIVKNPKTAGQAEQRAKLAPINATYRALKMIIDRGQEGKAYGNKSRLAWLSDAMKAFNGAWFKKGAAIVLPAWVKITKGSLAGITISAVDGGSINFICSGVTVSSAISTVGGFSTAILNGIPGLKEGDQLSFVIVKSTNGVLESIVKSVVLNKTDTTAMPFTVAASDDSITATIGTSSNAATIIVSREGSNGEHLRSTSEFVQDESIDDPMTDATAKAAAVESYMSAGANTDWAEESLQG